MENPDQRLFDYLVGELGPGEKDQLEAQLKTDPQLKSQLDQLGQDLASLKQVYAQEQLPEFSFELPQQKPQGKLKLFHLLLSRPQVALLAAACVALVAVGVFRQLDWGGIASAPNKVADSTDLMDMELGDEEMAEPPTEQVAASPEEELAVEPTPITGEEVVVAQLSPPIYIDGSPQDFENLSPATEKDREPPAPAVAGEPRRVAIKIQSRGLDNQIMASTVENQRLSLTGCLKQGYIPGAYLQVRVNLDLSGAVTKVSTIKANQMPLAHRACLKEAIGQIRFDSTGTEGSFTATLRFFENLK